MGRFGGMFSPTSLAAWGVAIGIAYYTTPTSKPPPQLSQQEINEINERKKRETGKQY
jgi:hypothetical protein